MNVLMNVNYVHFCYFWVKGSHFKQRDVLAIENIAFCDKRESKHEYKNEREHEREREQNAKEKKLKSIYLPLHLCHHHLPMLNVNDKTILQ